MPDPEEDLFIHETPILQQALVDVHESPRATIAKNTHATLVYVCTKLLGNSSAEYRRQRKDALLDIIDTYVRLTVFALRSFTDAILQRKKHSIISEDGALLVTKETRKSKPLLVDDNKQYEYGLVVLTGGTKSELDKLPARILLRLCEERLMPSPAVDWKTLKKADLLSLLHNFVRLCVFELVISRLILETQRARQGITDGAGKLLAERATHTRHGEDSKPVQEDELRIADEITEFGSTSKLKSIRSAVLVALCYRKLNMRVHATRKAAISALQEYVRYDRVCTLCMVVNVISSARSTESRTIEGE